MKNTVKTALIVLVSMVSVIVVYKLMTLINLNEKNIFDEMYYGEKKVYKCGANTPFSNIPGIEQWNRNDFMVNPDVKELNYRNNTIEERYKNKYKTRKIGEWNIRFSFNFEKKDIGINFSTEILKEKLFISFNYYYNIGEKIVSEEISLYDDKLAKENARIEDIPKIKEYLERNNISIKDLKETADELLYEKVIGDWEKYTNSRYSKDNLGTVKIERSQLFDGVD